MDQRNLRPAREFAIRYGVKTLCYGPAGSGKTPIFNTAPRPLLLSIETGMLSMRNSNVPTFKADTAEQIDEFFNWFIYSAENRNFDTLGIDSGTEGANRYLQRSERSNKHGLAAYGQMAEDWLKWLKLLYYMPQKHIYLICKQGTIQTPMCQQATPIFPGNELNREVPYLYDEILHLAVKNIPNVGQHLAFQTFQTLDVIARDRSGMLAPYEPPNLTALFQKAMQ